MSDFVQINPASCSVARPDDVARMYARTIRTEQEAAEDTIPVRRGDDRVEVSELATLMSKLRQLPIRQDLVERVRDEISRGVYESPEKLDAAINELVGEL